MTDNTQISVLGQLVEKPKSLERDREIADAVASLAADSLGLLSCWPTVKDADEPILWRAFAYQTAIAPPTSIRDALIWGLLNEDDVDDESTLLNILEAIGQTDFSARTPLRTQVAANLAGFLARCLTSTQLVAEAAVDTSLALPSAAWSFSDRAELEGLKEVIESFLISVTDPDLLASWHRGHAALNRVDTLQPLTKPQTAQALSELDGIRQTLDASSAASEAIGLLEPVLPAATVEITQTLTFATKSLLPLSILNHVSEAWASLYGAAVERLGGTVKRFYVEATQPGSFVLQVRVRVAAKDASIVATALEAAANEKKKLARAWRPFAQAILQHDATVTVSQTDKDEHQRSFTFNAESVLRDVRNIEAAAAVQLEARDIPQADNLERVLDLVSRIDSTIPSQIAAAMQITQRQVNYYKAAARALGLIDKTGAATSGGDHIRQLSGENRYRALVVYFEASRVGAAWLKWSGATTLKSVPAGSAEAFLTESVEVLSPITRHRRARTLEAWRSILVPHHYAAD